MLQKIKSYMMPLAMITGCVCYKYVALLAPITPFLIALMLFITYCSISLRTIRITRLHLLLLAIQLVGSLLVYLILAPINVILAQGAMICVLAPTATSAPIITNMLGGNVGEVAAYSLLSNLVLVLVAPLFFASLGSVQGTSFLHSVAIVGQKVFLLLLLPFVLAILVGWLLPRVHHRVKNAQSLSFYLWSAALVIITGKTVSFILEQSGIDYKIAVVMAIVAALICITQFVVGRRLGRKFGDTIAGGQSLGQKNTILAIWMAQTYLNPLSSIAPSAYILWQNMVNSYQVWCKRKS